VPGPRVYTIDEVSALIPDLEGRFTRLDEIREKLRRGKVKADAIEMIWGDQVHKKSNPDHQEYEHHMESLKELEEEFQRVSASFSEFSATVKGLEPGLLDFYGVREGILVFWCWRRGEAKCEWWHHLDAGFAGRRKA
jgi:hypothetical protein